MGLRIVKTTKRAARQLVRDHQQGATVVEAAIVLPLLFTLLFGVIEVGGMLKANSSAANAVRAGGRMASVEGNSGFADQSIMLRMTQEAAGFDKNEIEYVVIWHATGAGDAVPSGCKVANPLAPNTSSVGIYDGGKTVDALGACNVYIRPAAAGGAFDMANGKLAQPATYYFGCSGPSDPTASHKVDCNWSPSNRRTLSTKAGVTPVKPPDYVGVYLQAKHSYYTRLFGKTITVTDSAISLIEPQGYDP